MNEPTIAITPPSPAPEAQAPASEPSNSVRSLVQKWAHAIFTGGEDRLFLLLAILIGIFSGLLVVCFRVAIEWTQLWILGSSLAPQSPRVFLAPAVAGIGVALLMIYVFPTSSGSGVNQTKTAVYISNGYVPFRTVLGKFVMCALAIGSGQSLGPEDPSLQIGAGIASAIGRSLHLSQKKLRLIAPVGAAAGLAAAFNAPISAVLFVIEEVIGTWSAGVLGAIVLAAVSAAVTTRWFLGAESLFRVPPIAITHPAEFLGYAVLGVIGGVFSLLFLKWLAAARPHIKRLPSWTRFVLPSIAGLIVGLIGIKLPQVLGAGYSFMDQALHGQFVWQFLLLLAVAKILATGCSFLSGTPGGMFAPSLFIGAMLGGAVGGVEHHFFPGISTTVGTFALVGMGTFFAGFLRCPITSIFMVIEISGNYSAALPVMVSSLIAYLISRRYQEMSLFDMLARQDGMYLPSVEERREQVVLVVEDAMRSNAAIVASPAEPIADLASRVAQAKLEMPVLIQPRSGEWHLLDRAEIQKLADSVHSDAQIVTAADLQSKGPLPILFPDEPLEDVLHCAGDWSALPVVSRANLGKLEGVLALSDILSAFRQSAVVS